MTAPTPMTPRFMARDAEGNPLPHVAPTEDGSFADVLDLHYFRWAALSQSRMKLFARSPSHFKALAEDAYDRAPTEDQNLGSAAHMAALQPGIFAENFVPRPLGHHASNAYKDRVAAIRAENPWARILKPGTMKTARAIGEAVRSHDVVQSILKGATLETSVVWTEDEPDSAPLRLKGRLDVHNERIGLVADLKTCRDARPERFLPDAFRFGYHFQAAWYMRAAAAVGLAVRHYMIIAVEKTPPYGIVLHEITEQDLATGEDEIEVHLARFRQCQARGEWPGYPQRPEPLALNSYQLASIQDKIAGWWAAVE